MSRLFAALMTRFGPWLGRVAKQSPALIPQLTAKLRSSGAVLSDGITGVVNYFKSSPVAASLTLATLASFGVSVKELFDGIDTDTDPEVLGYVQGLERTVDAFTDSQRAAASALITSAGAASEKMNTGLAAKEVELLSAIEVLSWAKSHFGSQTSALRGHRLCQAFFEMPYDEVLTGFSTLRLN